MIGFANLGGINLLAAMPFLSAAGSSPINNGAPASTYSGEGTANLSRMAMRAVPLAVTLLSACRPSNGHRHDLGIAGGAILLSTILAASLAKRCENIVPQRLLVPGASITGGALSALATYVTIGLATGSTASTFLTTSVGIIGAVFTGMFSSSAVDQRLG